MATAMMVASAAMTIFSGFQQGKAQEAQGKRQQQIAQMQAERTQEVAARNALITRQQATFKAQQLEAKGVQEQASAQRAASEQRRQTRLTQSRARAVAGASGGGVGDPTSLDIYGGIAQEGQFAAETALFEGDSAANLLNSQAALALYEGEQQATSIEFGGAEQSSLLRYQGDVATFEGKQAAQQSRIGGITKAVGQVATSGISSKYAPSGSYSSATGSAGARSSYFPRSGETVAWR